MAQTKCCQFATDLKMPTNALLEQLQLSVTKIKAEDFLSEQDKSRLLSITSRHGDGDGKTKITLMRKQTGEIRAQDSHGKTRAQSGSGAQKTRSRQTRGTRTASPAPIQRRK